MEEGEDGVGWRGFPATELVTGEDGAQEEVMMMMMMLFIARE